MDIVSEESIDNTIIIPNITEAEAYFMPLIIESDKYFNNCEIKASSYDNILSQLIIIVNNSIPVLNSNCVQFKDQKYVFYQVDKRKAIIKLNDQLNPEFSEMIIENIFKGVKTNIKQIENDLLLINVDQNINFEILIKRVEKTKARCSIHIVPHSNNNDFEILYDKYFMSRRKTYFDLILQNSKILNAKSTDSKECQTDSNEMSSIPQISRNNNIFQNDSVTSISELNNNINESVAINANHAASSNANSELEYFQDSNDSNLNLTPTTTTNDNYQNFSSKMSDIIELSPCPREDTVAAAAAHDDIQMEDSNMLLDIRKNILDIISSPPRKRPLEKVNKLPKQESKLFTNSNRAIQNQISEERSSIQNEEAMFQPLAIGLRPNLEENTRSTKGHLKLENPYIQEYTRGTSQTTNIFSIGAKPNEKIKEELHFNHLNRNVNTASRSSEDLTNFFVNLLGKEKREEERSTLLNQENNLNNIKNINSNEDLRRLNTTLTKRVEDLESKMKILENKFSDFSKNKNNPTRAPGRRLLDFSTIRRDSFSSDTSDIDTQWVDLRRHHSPDVLRQNENPLRLPAWRSEDARNLKINNPIETAAAAASTASIIQLPPSIPVVNAMRAFDAYRDSRDFYENRSRTSNPIPIDPTQRLLQSTRPNTLRISVAGRIEKLSKEQIDRFPTTKYQEKKGKVAQEVCPICLDSYQANDDLRILSCFDKFHTKCIDHWLRQNNNCPCCKYDLLKHLNENRDN